VTAAVVAGDSGASAADFHGLPLGPASQRDTCNERIKAAGSGDVKENAAVFPACDVRVE
jgi:hypothetical protein